MTCGGGQHTLTFWVPSIPIPAPSGKRLLLAASRLDLRVGLIAWVQLLGRGRASIEDVYDELQAEPADPYYGPALERRLQAYIERNHVRWGIVDRVPSRRPSRRGAPVAVWGVRA